MCLIGLIGFLIGLTCECLSAVGITLISSHIRLPLSNLSGFDVDHNGYTYCYSGTYHRLQIFDSTGDFQRGWFVKAARVGEIHIDKSGNINFVDTSDKQFVFDINGNILEESEEDGAYRWSYELARKKVPQDGNGNVYKPHITMLNTRILKVDPVGAESSIITDPFYLLPFRIYYPTFLFIGVGGAFFLTYLQKYGRHRALK
ncbi:MAG: NHL repeat-containing protein [Planctomycetota bacterium]